MFKYGVIGIVLLIVLVIGGDILVNKSTEKTVTFKVKDKDRITKCNDGNCDSYYLVFTDHGTYKNADSLMYGKFGSSDLQGNLERGKRYTCKTAGVRVGFTSSYPNLIKCDPAT